MNDKPKPPPVVNATQLLWNATAEAAEDDLPEISREEQLKEREADFLEARKFLVGLENAQKYGLQYEYTRDVIDKLKSGSSIDEAIWHANWEWDL